MYFMRSVGEKSHLLLAHVQTHVRTHTHTHPHTYVCVYVCVCLRFAEAKKKKPQQVADSSHAYNIFALMAAGDAADVCSEGPAWRSETPALCVMRPQSSCEEFPFSEALNEDGCSPQDVFLLLASDGRALSLSLSRTSSGKIPPPLLFFFPVYLPVSLSCQLSERPRASSCGTARPPRRQLSSGLSSAIHTCEKTSAFTEETLPARPRCTLGPKGALGMHMRGSLSS